MKKKPDRMNSDLQIERLGEKIRSERKMRKITQNELAQLSKLGLNFISQIENGKNTAHIGKVFQVLNVLGFEIDVKHRK